jgi:DNA-binding winged helix-turn-helix (wHTH) protein
MMIYVFDNYELDTRLHELRCAGEAVSLEPLAFKVLTYLVQHHNDAVSKNELIEHLWSGQFLSDAVLVQSVVKARRAIGDDGQSQRCIKTIIGHGYRFIAPVEEYDALGYVGQAHDLLPALRDQDEGDQGPIVLLVLRLSIAPTERAIWQRPCVHTAAQALQLFNQVCARAGLGVAVLQDEEAVRAVPLGLQAAPSGARRLSLVRGRIHTAPGVSRHAAAGEEMAVPLLG